MAQRGIQGADEELKVANLNQRVTEKIEWTTRFQ